MPLTFLTADREFDEAAAGFSPLPHEGQDREQWRRPYRPGPWRVGLAAVLLLLASFVLLSSMVIAMAGSMAGAGGCAVIAAIMIAIAVRLLRMGVWVSQHGLRQIGLMSTVTLSWPQVASIRTRQQPVKLLGLPRTVQGQALVITTARGDVLRTVITDHNSDFLGRGTAFERAADVIEAWAAEHA
ncbi:hypothetical protein [Streptomyces zagrosensis]|uniref:PH domain-containing protein n=1 Tax=Streptomyces zagrosensis TaxID=1042984 RepID=A0A7W9QHZ6_9ACTN|nr:hypothetical protein [Streptomyces zagrosensis]MBB5940048.1 hypothetical protein [Streptomyces zagrosensis]